MKSFITILTPTYNRSNLLIRVFESLKVQTSKNFEWIIVDDGSTDNTSIVINNFNEESFPIHYFKKENGGKHTALNFGIKKANGTHILILDSDDLLPNNAIEIIGNKIKNCPPNLGGIVGRKSYLNGNFIGTFNYKEDFISNSLDIRYKYHVTGDLAEIFKTEILKKFPFPVFENEKFCPEALVWNRIAQKYDLLFFNESIYTAEYQTNGLTSSIIKIRMNSPKATMIHYSELASYNIPFKEKVKANINFWRFSFNTNEWSFGKKIKMASPIFAIITLPLGFLMFLSDKRKTK